MTVLVRPKTAKVNVQLSKSKTPRISKKVLIAAAGLFLLVASDIAFLEIKHSAGSKIDANQIISPWEHSLAPPQGFDKKQIKVHSAPKIFIVQTDGSKPNFRFIQSAHSPKQKMTLKARPVQGTHRARQTTAFAFAQQSYSKRMAQ